MTVCILGWYGSETLGDRAILEGILRILIEIDTNCNISLGSLYPFFTERTLYEESEYLKAQDLNINIHIFDERKGSELRKYIEKADLIMMGGGPLMDLTVLDIIEYSFAYAKKKKKITAVVGCGIGPLNKTEFKHSVYNILKNSDICIFRDSMSLVSAKKLNQEFGNAIVEERLYRSFDPAVLPVVFYNRNYAPNRVNRIIVNLRDISFQVNYEIQQTKLFDKISTLLRQISGLYDEVVLLPNHIFFLGGDDRLYLSKIKMELSDCSNIYVEHKPKSLSETFEIIAGSKAAIAMRYHAILFQTILNGNNYILDYTDSKIGKIISFLSDIDHEGFYKNRYCNVSSCDKDIQFEFSDDRFRFTYSIYDEIIEFYSDTIRSIL